MLPKRIRKMKNKVAILIIIISLSTIIFVAYSYYGNYLAFGGGTGAIYSPPSKTEINEGNAINSLQKSLPLSTVGFAITKYDYRKGQFVVQSYYQGADLQKEFDIWYATSSFSAIPKNLFQLPK